MEEDPFVPKIVNAAEHLFDATDAVLRLGAGACALVTTYAGYETVGDLATGSFDEILPHVGLMAFGGVVTGVYVGTIYGLLTIRRFTFDAIYGRGLFAKIRDED